MLIILSSYLGIFNISVYFILHQYIRKNCFHICTPSRLSDGWLEGQSVLISWSVCQNIFRKKAGAVRGSYTSMLQSDYLFISGSLRTELQAIWLASVWEDPLWAYPNNQPISSLHPSLPSSIQPCIRHTCSMVCTGCSLNYKTIHTGTAVPLRWLLNSWKHVLAPKGALKCNVPAFLVNFN